MSAPAQPTRANGSSDWSETRCELLDWVKEDQQMNGHIAFGIKTLCGRRGLNLRTPTELRHGDLRFQFVPWYDLSVEELSTEGGGDPTRKSPEQPLPGLSLFLVPSASHQLLSVLGSSHGAQLWRPLPPSLGTTGPHEWSFCHCRNATRLTQCRDCSLTAGPFSVLLVASLFASSTASIYTFFG